MRGILRTHYEQVDKYLNKLQEENITTKNSVCPEEILAHKEKLSEIYKNYRETFEKIAMLTIQFEEHRQSVKRLIILQKNKKKEILKRIKTKPTYSFEMSK
jgi:DNA-directed RNA polymerase subunit H (RpoH/RPB5)